MGVLGMISLKEQPRGVPPGVPRGDPGGYLAVYAATHRVVEHCCVSLFCCPGLCRAVQGSLFFRGSFATAVLWRGAGFPLFCCLGLYHYGYCFVLC